MHIRPCFSLLPMVAIFASAPVAAVPVEGDLGNHAAALLVALGVSALFLGFRNLRELRHKRMVPPRAQQGTVEEGD